ncbi:VTC domain-containing protein, partial [Bacteroidota bacterium]
DVFLEVKKKKNYTRTNKRRNQFEFSSNLEKQHIKFIKDQIDLPKSGLNSNIWTLFDRITLVGKNHLERVTIDTNIRFKNKQGEVGLPEISIIEVKRDKTTDSSPFISILNNFKIKPFGISKYIMGNILLNPEIKHNRFNRKIRTINKLRYGT